MLNSKGNLRKLELMTYVNIINLFVIYIIAFISALSIYDDKFVLDKAYLLITMLLNTYVRLLFPNLENYYLFILIDFLLFFIISLLLVTSLKHICSRNVCMVVLNILLFYIVKALLIFLSIYLI